MQNPKLTPRLCAYNYPMHGPQLAHAPTMLRKAARTAHNGPLSMARYITGPCLRLTQWSTNGPRQTLTNRPKTGKPKANPSWIIKKAPKGRFNALQ